jgi:hypothetical protein
LRQTGKKIILLRPYNNFDMAPPFCTHAERVKHDRCHPSRAVVVRDESRCQ